MSIAPANVQSSRDILSWQYKTLIGELQQVELHVSSGDCPCILKDLDPAEYCLAKHTLNIATLAAETANMDSANSKILAGLNDSAIEKHDGVKLFVCHKGDLPELAEWARLYRKKLEPIYYVCSRKAHMKQEVVTVICPPIWKTAEMSQEAVVCQRQAVDPRQLTIDKWLEEASKAVPAPADNAAIAQKLRAAADAMEKQIQAQLHPAIADQRPTGRRARIAEGMYREGVRLQEIQRALRGLADAQDAGSIPPELAEIRTKAQVEEIVTHRSFPRLGLHIERVKDILKPTQGLPGTREKWQILELAMRRSGSDYWIPLTEEEMAVTEDLLKISEQHGNKDPWTKLEFGHYKRLAAIGIRDDETFQAVKKAIADLVAGKPIEVPKDIQQRRLEAKLIGLKIPGFFTTPRELADRMVRMAGLRVGMKVLEPSAGSGNIADAIKAACPECRLTLVEYHQTLLEILKTKGYDPVPGDFLQFKSGGYDRIVMNPPFEHGQDVDHVRHAFELLKEGGRVVAIMGEHAFFGGDSKSIAFRTWLEELGVESEELPSGTFEHQATSTGVASRLVVIDKPEDLAVSSDREVVEWVKSRQGRGYPAQDLASLVQYPDQPERALLVQSIVKYLDNNKATHDEYKIRVPDIPELQPFIDEYEVAGAILRGQPVPRSILKSAWVPKMGDKVEYQGEVWEVGFVNNRTTGWAGTLRLQKSGDAGARSVNRVDPREVKPVEAAIAQTAQMGIDYSASGCEAGIGRYVDAIAGLERLRDKVREQHEYAPGRLRDLFDGMPGAITRALIIDEGPLVEALQSSRQHALKIIDQARDEMMRRKTKNVAVYLPSYRPGLEKVITDLQRLLFQEVMGAASDCLCTNGPVQQRFSGLQGRRGIQRQGAGAMEQVAVCNQEVVTCSANGATCAVMPETAGPSAAGEKVYELFPFQEEGVAWLKGRSFALLADDMGLGKTPQGIHWGADFRPVLVVVPSALTLNWQREITQMWRKADAAILLDGTNELPAPLPDWTIISYGRLDRYLPQLRRAGFGAIIIDEAHSVKNLESQRTQFLLELVDPHQPHDTDTPIPNRLAITGTPILNKPIEIFPLLVFLGLKKREDLTDFVKEYSQWHLHGGKISYSGVRNLDKLNQYLKTFMLRRLKKDVLTTLPPKLHTSLFVPISNAMEYAQAERDFVSWLNEHLGDAAPQDMTMKMNVLRQIASNGKVQPVCDWLKPCVQGGGKVILFSSFIEPLEKLSDCQPASVLYTGSNTSPERQAMVDDFQKNPETCFFMGSVGAAGVGITLTAANRVAFLDLPWTPGAKAQAEDRAHRIGQTRPVEIVHVLAKGTIDERMLEILSEKEKIIAQAIDGQGKSEAEASSIAESLIQHYRSTPAIAGLHQYETEERDTPIGSLTEDDLRILQGDMRQEAKMCQVSTISKADAIRKAHDLSQKRIDAFDPEAAVTKIGKRWTYTGYSGTQHPSLFDTRKEAVEAATGHKKLKQDEFDNPEGYWPGVSTPVTISGVCEKGKPCSIKVKASDVEEETTTIGLLPEAINDVVRKLERHRAAPISDLTFAIGPTTLTRYEFRNRLVEAEALKASHNPITFEPTPGYPAELQPRLRARSANKTQVQTIAANLDPDSLLSDFHSIDRGAPIVGPDLAVESGNGRVMALQLAIVQHPEVYAKYRAEVIARAEGLGLSPEQAQSMMHPVVVRERVTDVPRRQFVEEANASTTLAPSAIEVARSDALKVTPDMLNNLVVGEEQSIEDALRSAANRAFVTAFLGKLSQNEIAQISDKYGAMNQDGIRRLTLAVFVAAFPGEAGLSLAEKFFESTEPTIRNIANGIAQALGKLAKVEAKDASLAIGVDIAAAARVFADIKKTPGMTVPNYLSQGQMFEKQLKPFQEVLLTLLDERARSGKRVGALLRAYCDVVLEAPPPQQIGLMPDISRLTKEEALKIAVKRAEEQIEGPRLFQAAACPQHPAWCSALTKARTELDRAVKSLSASKVALQKYRGQLDRPLQVCQGQTPMFQGEQKMRKDKSVGCGKVSITGKCEDGIGTCKFTLKRQCSPIKVTGIEPLKDAYHKLTGEDLPADRIEKATMGVCPPCLVAAPAKRHESRERG